MTTASAQGAGDGLAQIVTALMVPAAAQYSFNDWRALEAVKQIRWASLPPNMLDESLPDGSYFKREGVTELSDRRVNVTATGARTMVMNVYLSNDNAPIGASAVVGALERRGFKLALERCPISSAPGRKWWRISAPGKRAAILSLQTSCNGASCEKLALLLDDKLPSLTPQEEQLYTDLCTGPAAGTRQSFRAPWDEQLVALFHALIPARGVASVDWPGLDKATGVNWKPLPPLEIKGKSPWDDPNRHYRGGEVDLGGRILTLTATGTKSEVLNVYIFDGGMQADRGDVLRALQRKGYGVQLARCGKVYTHSKEEWYRVNGPGSSTVMLMRGIRCDTIACPKAQESYTVALTGRLPPAKPGEVDATAGSCPGR